MLRKMAKYAIVNALWSVGHYQRVFANLKIPFILKYHRTGPDRGLLTSGDMRSEFESGVRRSNLEAQMRLLLRYRRPVPMDELARALSKGGPVPENAVALTFDDGYSDNYEIAYPVLKRHGIPATFYVCPGLIDARKGFWWDEVYACFRHTRVSCLNTGGLRQEFGGRCQLPEVGFALKTSMQKQVAANMMISFGKQITANSIPRLLKILKEELQVGGQISDGASALMMWPEIKEMANNGMDFGNHTMTHPMMTHISEKELQAEVQEAQTRLQSELRRPISGFVYPSGNYDELVREMVRKTGHSYACTSDSGFVTQGDDTYLLKRVNISDGNMAFACREIILTHGHHAASKKKSRYTAN
ncbi:MAG: hypothetical protein A4E19_20910 [Nitrospira sp. SG-bin1]|nr:MAG: hypothetical protein A4E19_20910 [Nitrospira sp. SG-bin1]